MQERPTCDTLETPHAWNPSDIFPNSRIWHGVDVTTRPVERQGTGTHEDSFRNNLVCVVCFGGCHPFEQICSSKGIIFPIFSPFSGYKTSKLKPSPIAYSNKSKLYFGLQNRQDGRWPKRRIYRHLYSLSSRDPSKPSLKRCWETSRHLQGW